MASNFVNFAYMIFVTPNGKGYGCFAIKKLGRNMFSVAASFCSPFDVLKFDKNKARMIAKNRLGSDNTKVDIKIDDAFNDDFQTIHHILFESTDMDFPNWAVRAYLDGAYYLTLRNDNMSYFDMVYDKDMSDVYFRKYFNDYGKMHIGKYFNGLPF